MSSVNPRRRGPVTRSQSDAESDLALITSTSLRKGATFHSPTSPVAADSDDFFIPPQLSRSQSHLDEVVDANRRRIALTLSDIDEALAKTEALSLSPKPTSKKPLRDVSLPVPRGFLDPPVVDPAMATPDRAQRRVLRPRSVRRSNQHASDSGLGSSVASTKDKGEGVQTASKDTNTKTTSASALNGSGASAPKQMLPALSRKAFNRIHEHTLRPLLERPSLKDFKPIVLDVPRRIRSKEIICLRDLEKTLIFMAPVSQLLTDDGVWGVTYRNLCLKRAKTMALYLDFCLSSIRCIQATVEFLPEREQVRPGDRPYTNGYFLDLKEQIYHYGRQLADVKEKGVAMDDMMNVDQYVPRFVPLDYVADNSSRNDEIRLVGGLAEDGRHAELIRIRKDGSAVSLATGEPVDLGQGPVKFKRSLSQQREDEEEIMRSMARRKKNASPEELAPKKCGQPGCGKEFKRPCDLTKHEKTHLRPWKCPIPTCKYNSFGWPTEKEKERHVNDKHSDKPAMYSCLWEDCAYQSKRESNCKQHMEKTHGWTYVRTKSNGKKAPSVSGSSVQPTPALGNVTTPSTSTPSYNVPTPPLDQDAMMFPALPADADWFAQYGIPPESVDLDLVLENPSPSSATSYENYPPYQNGSAFILSDEDIYAATVQLPAQPQQAMRVPHHMFNKAMAQQLPVYQAPQPYAAPQTDLPLHFSPAGQENAMLFTPGSLREVEEGFDEAFNGSGSDFQLFPGSAPTATKIQDNFQQSLFGEVPSADMGFSQMSQQDIFQQIDWSTVDLQSLQE